MRPINIQSILQAETSLKEPSFNEFLKHYGIEIKRAEIDDLRVLAEALRNTGCGTGALGSFYIGYKIPQISKEFDLLRFGRNIILNIELKNECAEDRIERQLLRNKYYLSFVGKKVRAFTFVSASKNLYSLGEDGSLQKASLTSLVRLLTSQEIDETAVPDNIFDPSDYLVSPFNSTTRFLSGEYFLTHQQEEIKSQIVAAITTPRVTRFISITGSAGTGKTLLTYDIAKYIIDGKRQVLIIHCGQLNRGQRELLERGWTIIPIKSYEKYNFAHYDLVIVDEAQRIYASQLATIIQNATTAQCCCIFSYDKLQTLASWEQRNDVSTRIDSIANIVKYKLSEKIRTNKEIANFIKMLFNNRRASPVTGKGSIEINYFSTIDDAKSYLDALDEKKWEVLRFTPSQYKKEHHEKYSGEVNRTSHQVIGQEFDGVAVTIDRYFSYSDSGDLIYTGGVYYDAPKMLFQNLTRARKKLNLVIIGNGEVLERCVAILAA